MANNLVEELKERLLSYADREKADFLPRFFKTGKGQYGEGDQFIGVIVPNTRIVAREFRTASLNEIQQLLNDPIHEVRLCAVLILVAQFEKTKNEAVREQIFGFYLKNATKVNNWDLVDSSAPGIVGGYLRDKEREVLYQLAESSNLWEQRISIIATLYFIKKLKQVNDTYELADKLLNHKHDLIHKAVGWMLREAGKLDEGLLDDFLLTRYQTMPRTMLRYAIEKMEEGKRKRYLIKEKP